MKSKTDLRLLKITLILFAFFIIINGIFHLFMPALYVKASQAGPVAPGWIRWFGPVLISLGLGAILVYRNPHKQGIFVLLLALGTFTCGLTLIYSIFFDNETLGLLWDTGSQAFANFVFSILFWISLRQGKNILW